MSIGQYNYVDLYRTYLNQSQSKGKTAGGRLSFTGTNLYSYNSLLAQLDVKNKVILVDKYIANYSVTSKNHFRQLQAIVKFYKVFTLYKVDFYKTPIENLKDFIDLLNTRLLQYKRARQNKPYIKNQLLIEYNHVKSYIDYTNIDKRTKPYKQFKQFFNTMFEAQIL